MENVYMEQLPECRVWLVALFLMFLCALGIISGKVVKTHKSYLSSWGQCGYLATIGGLMAVALGSGTTIGTAQVAYIYGFDALWFGFGMALGLVLLCLVLVGPTRKRGGLMANALIAEQFGRKVGQTAAIVSSICLIPSAVTQLTSAGVLINFLFQVPELSARTIGGAIMLSVVFLGGLKGTELIGMIKTAVLLVILPICLVIIAVSSDSFALLDRSLPHEVYCSFFSRGILRNLCNGIGIGTGMLAVHANLLPLIAAKSDKVARRSCMISAAVMVIISLCSCIIGMFMRCVIPDMDASKAFLTFVLSYLPPVVGELVISVMFVAVASSGASLFLGISAVFVMDILGERLKSISEEKKLKISRAMVLLSLIGCYLLTLAGEGLMIVDWSFISSALRSSCFLFPLLFSVYQTRYTTKSRNAALAIMFGPLSALAGYLIGWEALPTGLLASMIILLAGLQKVSDRL